MTEIFVKSLVEREPCSGQHLKMAYFVIKQSGESTKATKDD